MESKLANARYPSFKELVDFLSKEADLACDPISSIQAVKRIDGETQRQHRGQTIQAKTLSTNTAQHNIPLCDFCKRTGHVLANCRKFCEKTVQDCVKFVQTEKLCFGCLKTGHHSRSCDNRSTCERCQKKHPTCLHVDKFSVRQTFASPKGDNNLKDKAVTKETVSIESCKQA